MSLHFSQDSRRIDPDLRAKYDVRGPRYTSYPPATHFHEINPEELVEPIRERNRIDADPGLSLYFHIPFCRSKCLFCGCHTFIKSARSADSYLDAVIAEMDLIQTLVDPLRPVFQVALGGGTPNFLGVGQINRLGEETAKRFRMQPEAEMSVEIDPRTSSVAKLDAFLEHGFNRFSLGVQDLNAAVLQKARCGQDDMQVEEVVEHLRARGIMSINFDLIYGLPGQNVDTAADTAERVCRFRPTRIALYSYAHVPWIRPHQKALEKFGLPESELKSSLFLTMMDVFLKAGYVSIGMDHFALPEDPLALAFGNGTLRRNFMGYTTGRGLDLLGFGASAISSVGRAYYQNEKQLEDYRQCLAQTRLPIAKGFLLSKDDRFRRELIMELFCNFHVDMGILSRAYGLEWRNYLAEDLTRLEQMRKDGLVDWDEGGIRVSDVGRFFRRNICMVFDRYLESDLNRRMYSRTV